MKTYNQILGSHLLDMAKLKASDFVKVVNAMEKGLKVLENSSSYKEEDFRYYLTGYLLDEAWNPNEEGWKWFDFEPKTNECIDNIELYISKEDNIIQIIQTIYNPLDDEDGCTYYDEDDYNTHVLKSFYINNEILKIYDMLKERKEN